MSIEIRLIEANITVIGEALVKGNFEEARTLCDEGYDATFKLYAALVKIMRPVLEKPTAGSKGDATLVKESNRLNSYQYLMKGFLRLGEEIGYSMMGANGGRKGNE